MVTSFTTERYDSFSDSWRTLTPRAQIKVPFFYHGFLCPFKSQVRNKIETNTAVKMTQKNGFEFFTRNQPGSEPGQKLQKKGKKATLLQFKEIIYQ